MSSNIDSVVLIGILGFLLISGGIVHFMISSQRKLFVRQRLINELKMDHQRRLIEAEIIVKEREQKRIAEELHDDIGASLSSMRFMVGQLSKKEGAEELEETLSDTIQKVRRISNDLLPAVLDELGIADALRSMIGNLKSVPLEMSLTVDAFVYDSLQKDQQLILYRIVQEIVNNIIKHAEASNVHIHLGVNRGVELFIEITDDGNGILPERDFTKNPNSLGLKNIESRIGYIGGTISRERGSVNGTKVLITKTLG